MHEKCPYLDLMLNLFVFNFDSYPVFMTNSMDKPVKWLLFNAKDAFTAELFILWLENRKTVDLYTMAGKEIPKNRENFDE